MDPKEHVIDCDAPPLVGAHFKKVERHQKGGLFKWNCQNVELYRVHNLNLPETRNLLAHIPQKRMLNANVLDYLCAHPHLIPQSWKEVVAQYEGGEDPLYLQIYFLGTVYQHFSGCLCARYLVWDGTWYQSIGEIESPQNLLGSAIALRKV